MDDVPLAGCATQLLAQFLGRVDLFLCFGLCGVGISCGVLGSFCLLNGLFAAVDGCGVVLCGLDLRLGARIVGLVHGRFAPGVSDVGLDRVGRVELVIRGAHCSPRSSFMKLVVRRMTRSGAGSPE